SDVLEPYQRERLEAFVDLDADPLGAGYNQRQSLTAIGSGGLSGKGLFNGPQTQLRYLPEQQTDFIFAVVGEELGFVGALAIVVLEGLILHRILAVAKTASDPFGSLVCAGIFSSLAFQVVQNVAMNLRLLPVTGIPLPFVSYGGSSLLASFAAVGIVQSVARHRMGNRAAPELVCPGQGLYAVGERERGSLPSRLATGWAR
ncbi:MAG: FtsW/RodA/SpoVE family cell cycle protein, partial [Acidimicrobiia bacterium]|nr:FtsW/RodA/SpoVE family cell cycle protein [Acidimicrobiia bacterium]